MNLAEIFEAAALGVPHEEEFRDIEIVAHDARTHGRVTALSLTVDRPGGVDLARCERIAAHINAALEGSEDAYTLEVESAGIDRPLRAPADYERFRDSDVVITTTLPIASEYTHRGKLTGLRGNAAVLATKRGELPIPLEMIKAANVEYDFRADLRRAKSEKRATKQKREKR